MASCGLRVGDELVDGHRPPGGGAHRCAGGSRRDEAGPDRGDEVVGTARAGLGDGLVPALLQEPAPRLGPQRPPGRQVGLGWRVGGVPGRSGHRVDDQRPARGQPGADQRRAAGPAHRRPCPRPCRSARRAPRPAAATARRCSATASPRRSSAPSSAGVDERGSGDRRRRRRRRRPRCGGPATRRRRRRGGRDPAPWPTRGHGRLDPPGVRPDQRGELDHAGGRDALHLDLPLELLQALVDDVQGAAHRGRRLAHLVGDPPDVPEEQRAHALLHERPRRRARTRRAPPGR